MQQIQNKLQLNMLWKGHELFHSELYSVNDFDEVKESYHETKANENPTIESVQDAPKIKIKTFSKKKLTPKYEISFEKNFMKEHKAAFQKYYQNCIESMRLQLSQKKIQSILQQFFKSKGQTSTHLAADILKTEESYLSSQQRNQFLKDLQHEQKLHQFLNFIADFCKPNMAIGFLRVAFVVWMAFVPIQNEQLKISEIVQFAKRLAKQEITDSIVDYFGDYIARRGKIDEEFLNLIEVFCTTILLAITGYFENPFFAEDHLNDYKRSFNFDLFSDEDSSPSLPEKSPYKKRKSSLP